jgi:hypothetical protein
MKRFAFIMALLLLQTQVMVSAASATYNKKPAQKTQATKPVNSTKSVYTQDGSDYLLKYNIKDLEAAPWLNNGTRKPEQ